MSIHELPTVMDWALSASSIKRIAEVAAVECQSSPEKTRKEHTSNLKKLVKEVETVLAIRILNGIVRMPKVQDEDEVAASASPQLRRAKTVPRGARRVIDSDEEEDLLR